MAASHPSHTPHPTPDTPHPTPHTPHPTPHTPHPTPHTPKRLARLGDWSRLYALK
ncbi:MAG: hypothetical protein F6J93_13250 [Oscillatoria sp. SIO1A7]|nr:hypothetical protein [Oscillatoria sp. SIO1A7]